MATEKPVNSRTYLFEEIEYQIPESLIQKQNLNQKDVDAIIGAQVRMRTLQRFASEEPDIEKKKDYIKAVEELEYLLQAYWGFDLDSNYHTWWNKFPDCTCPKMDNEDLIGTSDRIITSDCPYHGR